VFRCTFLFSTLLFTLSVTADGGQPAAAADPSAEPLPDGALARIGTVRWRHGGQITFAAFRPDGKAVLSVSEDRTLRVWEYPSGKELCRIVGPTAADVPAKGDVAGKLGGFGGPLRNNNPPAALSGDGKTIAVAFERFDVRFYEVATGKELPTLTRATGATTSGVKALAFAPDGRHLVVQADDGSVRVWDWAGAKELRAFASAAKGALANVPGPTYSPDGKFLVAVQTEVVNNKAVRMIKVWDPATGTALRSTLVSAAKKSAVSVAFSPDSKALAVSGIDGMITLVHPATGKEIRSWDQDIPGPVVLLFGRDGTRLYALSAANRLVVEWEAATGKELRKLELDPPASGARLAAGPIAALSPDGKLLLLTDTDNRLRFFDLAAGKDTATGAGPAPTLVMVQFTPDGKRLVSQSNDGTARVWQAATGKALATLVLPKAPARTLISPDGKWLAVMQQGAKGGALVDADTGKEVLKIPPLPRDANPTMLFAPDSKTLAVRYVQEQQIALYDVPGGKAQSTVATGPFAGAGLPKGAPGAPPATMFYSADSKLLAAFTNANTLTVWDTASGQRVATLTSVAANQVQGAAFTPDGRCLALDTGDGTVTLYELASGQVRRSYGTRLASGKGPAPGRLPGLLPGSRVVFARDSNILIHAGPDNAIRFFDVTSGKELTAFTGHAGPINALAVAPDGKTLVSASTDTTALVWDLTRVVRPAAAVKVLGREECEERWQALLTGQAASFAAICDLTASPQEAVALVREHVKPAPFLNTKRVEQLIADLDSNQYKLRQQANDELGRMDERIVPLIDKALATNPPLEVKIRLDELRRLMTIVTLQGERLRVYRAVEVLERIGNAEARQLLQALADGAPGALVTTAAQQALQRLAPLK
jgi:WD40 repeat protein